MFMRSSQLHAPTLKEVPRDAEVVSHQLLVRGGYIRRVAAGVYNFLPLGHKVLMKVAQIVREEMNRSGAQEVLMPLIQPAELWQESDRWAQYGPEMMRLKDRRNGDFCLGPTHEEVIVDLVRRDVRSWRALPINLYQIQSKFRDEIRPRAGLLRGREFMMKDAYSFDVDEQAAGRSYDAMYEAYQRIFNRCGLNFRPVEADTGAIGGSRSHEFQVLVDSGEDAIVGCSACDYAANVEQAEVLAEIPSAGADAPLTRVDTPNVKTMQEVAAFFDTPLDTCVKSLLLIADEVPVLALVRGDHDLNEIKLKKSVVRSHCEWLPIKRLELI
jgi:prolyl-tRNA synthetase